MLCSSSSGIAQKGDNSRWEVEEIGTGIISRWYQRMDTLSSIRKSCKLYAVFGCLYKYHTGCKITESSAVKSFSFLHDLTRAARTEMNKPMFL